MFICYVVFGLRLNNKLEGKNKMEFVFGSIILLVSLFVFIFCVMEM